MLLSMPNLLFNDAYIIIMYNLPCVLPKLRRAVQSGGELIIADVNIDIAFETVLLECA